MRLVILAFLLSFAFGDKWIIFHSSNKEIMAKVDRIEIKKSFVNVKERREIAKEGFVRFYETRVVKKPVFIYSFFYRGNLIYKVKKFKKLDLFKDYILIGGENVY
jgi:hypothetical protein